MLDEDGIGRRYEAIREKLDERRRRLFAAAEVRSSGHGGIAAVSRAAGIARSAIGGGPKELDQPPLAAGRARRRGSGRRPPTATDAALPDDPRRLVEPAIRGDPMRPPPWVSKSHAKLAATLA